MSFFKSILLLFTIVLSCNTLALTTINDSANLGMLRNGITIKTNVAGTSKEGEFKDISRISYGIGSPDAYGSEIAILSFYNTHGRKLTLKANSLFKVNDIKMEKICANNTCWFQISGLLESNDAKINTFNPAFRFDIIENSIPETIGELRKILNYEFEFYYAPGDEETIEL